MAHTKRLKSQGLVAGQVQVQFWLQGLATVDTRGNNLKGQVPRGLLHKTWSCDLILGQSDGLPCFKTMTTTKTKLTESSDSDINHGLTL